MTNDYHDGLSRRQWLRASSMAAGGLLIGAKLDAHLSPARTGESAPFADDRRLGILEFIGEGPYPIGTTFGTELDGRLYTDLSSIPFRCETISTEKFYIRTRTSKFYDPQLFTSLSVASRNRAMKVNVRELATAATPLGLHVMECAGNTGLGRFGLIGVADWEGVPLRKLFERFGMASDTSRILISGFDNYSGESKTSIPGASWIFSKDDLLTYGSFLATKMNGGLLPLDHGAPLRLVVPGWYGCACIKWVNGITEVNDGVEATTQMQEYAARTQQDGVPTRARDYKPAVIDPAAMPIRVEKWISNARLQYRVVGILWGGSQSTRKMKIQFNPDEPYEHVAAVAEARRGAWTFWTHIWHPRRTGTYSIRLKLDDSRVQARRLDAGYYTRTVRITEL